MTMNIVIGVLFFVAALFLMYSAANGFSKWKENAVFTAITVGVMTLSMISIVQCGGPQ